jgi:hypothetical protein
MTKDETEQSPLSLNSGMIHRSTQRQKPRKTTNIPMSRVLTLLKRGETFVGAKSKRNHTLLQDLCPECTEMIVGALIIQREELERENAVYKDFLTTLAAAEEADQREETQADLEEEIHHVRLSTFVSHNHTHFSLFSLSLTVRSRGGETERSTQRNRGTAKAPRK